MLADRQIVSDMFDAGASGYLLKDSVFEELFRAIRTVVGNWGYIDPAIKGARTTKAGVLVREVEAGIIPPEDGRTRKRGEWT
jgi:DNA-binding NarL/FixJ family response regulator